MYGYRRRYSPYRSWRRNSVYRSQTNGTRRFSVSIPVEAYASVPVVSGSRNTYSIVFQPWYTSNSASATVPDYYSKYGNVINNGVYQIYTRLYDEVKIDGVSLQVAVQGLPTSVNGFKCVSAVDRHYALSDISSIQGVSRLMGAPESMSKTFTSLQNAKIYRSFWARDIGERTTFADSSLGTKDIAQTQTVPAYQMAGLTEFLNDATYQVFCPGITLGFELGAAPASAGTVEIQYKIVWKFTFRNPKYGGGTLSRGFETFSETRAEEIADLKKEIESDGGTSEGSALRKKVVKIEEPVYEEEVVPDDEKDEMEDDSQPELTKEQLLEMLKKFDEKNA